MSGFKFKMLVKLIGDCKQDEAIERLLAGGCDDAIIGSGKPDMLALSFNRVANNLSEAMESALNDIKKSVPQTTIIQVDVE